MARFCFLRIHIIEWVIGGLILGVFSLGVFAVSGISTSPSTLRGLLLIQAEARGEGWYIVPESGKRLYLGKPREALLRLRAVGMPITSAALDRIPQRGSVFSKVAGDHIGATTKKYLGAILIRADRAPYDAWYVHPITGVRHPLHSPFDTLALMRDFSLGIAEDDIARIPIETLEEDRFPLAIEPLISERTTIIPGRTSFAVANTTIERIEKFAADSRANKAVAGTYIFASIDHTPVLVYPRYGSWFILGPSGSADSFRLVDLLDGYGTLYRADGAESFYGLYAPLAKEDRGPVFLIERGGQIATLEIGIIATETRYSNVDAQSLSLFSNTKSPIFSGMVLSDSTAVYVFHNRKLTRLGGADRTTLQTWQTQGGSPVFGDTHGLYATDREADVYRVPVSDPLTVRINRTQSAGKVASLTDAEGDFYIDPASGRIRRAESREQGGVQRIAQGIIAKDGHVYIESPLVKSPIPLEGVTADSFFVLPQSEDTLYSDGVKLYYRPSANPSPNLFVLSSLDTASFQFLAKTKNGILLKDRNGVYTISSDDGALAQIADADAESFRLLYADGEMLVAKDANHVFAGEALRQVSGADAASFHMVFTIEGIPFGRDRNAIYYALPRDPTTFRTLTAADPSTFVVRTIPAAEPALRTLAHQGTDRIVYAIDRQWIWFYDGKRDGLLVIRRADQSEKVSDAQIIDFARMYANAVP
ncbi:DKNYY domain-containing protein [Candidatus Uhrbacteria bacterium]|nr:DKNYY domain-containing protein [Candidatus Uhrbacteria bacterium]